MSRGNSPSAPLNFRAFGNHSAHVTKMHCVGLVAYMVNDQGFLIRVQQMYKYAGIATGGNVTDRHAKSPVGPWGVYHLRFAARLFSPHFAVAAHCPFRANAWLLQSEGFDYRSAHNIGAL